MDAAPLSLDEELVIKKDLYLDPNFDTQDGLEACKAALCVFIHNERFEQATELYDLIVRTGLYDISTYWKTGLLIARSTNRDCIGYLEAAHRICLNRKKVEIFLAYLSELIVNNMRDVARENITVIWAAKHGNDPDVQDLLALLDVMDFPEQRLKYLKKRFYRIPTKSTFWPSWRPTDKQVLIEYLNYLQKHHPDEVEQAAILMLKRAGQISSLDYMRTVLQYYNPPLNPFNEWCQLMKPYHYLHPGANYRIFAKPFLKGQLNQCNGHLGHTDTLIPFKEMYNLLKDRLFTTWFDRWTVKKFIWLCKASLKIQDAEQKIKFTKIIEASELHEFIQLRRKEIDEEILLEIKNNYEHYDHDTIMSLLGRLQEIHMMLEKVCQVLDFVQKVINNFGVDRQVPNDDYEVPDKTQSTDVVVDEEELINETNLAIEEYEENGTNSAGEEYEANETNSVDKLIRDEEEAPKEKKSRIRKHTNLADVLVNNKEKHKKKKKKGRINREPRFY